MYLLGNWQFHRSNYTLSKLKRLNLEIMFLPANNPDYAPVDV